MAGLAKKLKIQNCVNSTGNCVHYMYRFSRFSEKLNIQICVKLCILYVRIVWICRKIEYSKERNSMSNCVHYMCEMSGFVEKFNIQNRLNSM